MHSKNSLNAIKTLQFFRETITKIADEQGTETSKITDIGIRYAGFVEDNHAKIFENMASELGYYLNFYNVYPSNDVYDEFKNYYFLGTAITKELEQRGMRDLVKLQLLAVQRLLDLRLHSVEARRQTLTKRMVDAIENGSVAADFGRFGWYILYKCLFNAATERQQ